MRKAPFIALVGADGAGKTAISALLCEQYAAEKVREPGGTEIAELIRSMVKDDSLWPQVPTSARMLYFWAARVDLLVRVVRPHLESGRMVITDRFDACTYAYQVKAESSGISERLFWEQRDAYVVESGLEPDLYIWLDLDPGIGIKRRTNAGASPDFYDKKGPHFFQKIRAGYREFFREAEAPYVCINAEPPVPVVFKEVMAAVESILTPVR